MPGASRSVQYVQSKNKGAPTFGIKFWSEYAFKIKFSVHFFPYTVVRENWYCKIQILQIEVYMMENQCSNKWAKSFST